MPRRVINEQQSSYQCKNSFLEEYIDFVARTGEQIHRDAWWLSWIASKNRFNSSLLPFAESLWRGDAILLRGSKTPSNFASILTAIRYTLRLSAEFILAKWSLGRHLGKLRLEMAKKSVYGIKTFSYGHSFSANGFNDVFFGRLPHHLREQRQLNVITLIDPIGAFRKTLRGCLASRAVLPFHVFLRWYDFPIIWLRIIRALFLKFPEKIYFCDQNLNQPLRKHFRSEVLTANSVLTLAVGIATKRFAETFKLSHFLMTQENNPWERFCTLAVKSINKETKTIGYQHTVVTEASANMFAGKGEVHWAPLPQTTITVGAEPAQILKEHGHFDGFNIVPGCGLRFEYLEAMKPKSKPIEKKLLIALEGVPQAIEMLEFAVSQLKTLDWKVTVRTHPALRLADMSKPLREIISNHRQFTISEEGPVLRDLGETDVVLYWGTTVALEALKLGNPVIHFDRGDLLSYDPLFRLHDLKWIADRNSDISKILNEIISIDLSELTTRRQKAQTYLESYFHKVTPENLDKFL